MKAETLRLLLADRAAKRPVVLATDLESGAERLIHPYEERGSGAVDDAARDAIVADRSRTVEDEDGRRFFLHVFNPPLRLMIVGAVHVAQGLSRMAAICGYDVTVIDPRGAFASEDRFPGLNLSTDWPDEALTALGVDTRTAVVLLSHDPKLDDPALHVVLKSPAFYIGALSSKRTHAKRIERLKADGLGDDELARIRAPIGLDIGAKSPPEIAVAIMAEMTQVLRERTA